MAEPMSEVAERVVRDLLAPENGVLTLHEKTQLRAVLAEVDRLRAQIGTPADPADVFEPGRIYRSENGYFEFRCERRIGEYALGIETVLKDWPVRPGTRFYRWASIGPSAGYHDVTDDQPTL